MMPAPMTRTKAHWSGAGSGTGAALAVLVVAAMRHFGIDWGPEAEVAIGIVITGLITWVTTERAPRNRYIDSV